METEAKAELNKKAQSDVILCLSNKVMREVTGETIAAEDVMATLNSKEIKERFKAREGGRVTVKGYMRGEELIAGIRISQEEPTGYVKKDDQPSSSGSIYDGSEVMMAMSAKALLDWIMDSGCSYHMTPMLDLFFDFLEYDRGRVLLGDNKECKIRGIDKTPMETWSGHSSDYGMLWVFGCVAYSYGKQGKLEPRAVKCVLLGYHEGLKGYKLYRLDDELPKIVTSKNVVFNESVVYKDTLKDSGAGIDKSVDELQVEVELEPKTKTKPLRFRDESNMAVYAFAASEEEDTHEPLTYQEAVVCEDNSKWKAAIE
nr:hypothetical protein [Tanacetum cinerariifolium]